MFSIMMGDAPIAEGAPAWVVPVKSLHCETVRPGRVGTAVLPQGTVGQEDIAVLSHATIPS